MSKSKLINLIEKSQDSCIILIINKTGLNESKLIKSIEYFCKKKIKGAVIVFNKPYEVITEKIKCSLDNVLFVDCVTKIANNKPEKKKNVLFMSGPRNLSEIGMAIDTALDSLKREEKKFLIIDSISTLLIYHNSNTISRFIHFITSKLRENSVYTIFNILKSDLEDNSELSFAQFVDHVIEN